MLEWCTAYAKMFGVVAAVIILGSWLVQNTALEQAKSLRDALASAEAGKMAMETDLRLESRLLEVYQVASSARKYAHGAQSQHTRDFKDDLYEATERLERVGVTRNFALLHHDYARRSKKLLDAFSASEATRKRMTAAISEVSNVLKVLEERHQRYVAAQKAIVGEVINPNTITQAQASQLEILIDEYRNDVEFSLAPRLAPAANEMFRATDEVLVAARLALTERQKRVKLLRQVQIALYLIGSALALFGSYLQARPAYKQPTTTQNADVRPTALPAVAADA